MAAISESADRSSVPTLRMFLIRISISSEIERLAKLPRAFEFVSSNYFWKVLHSNEPQAVTLSFGSLE